MRKTPDNKIHMHDKLMIDTIDLEMLRGGWLSPWLQWSQVSRTV